MVCPPATSEAEAIWPKCGLVVVATYSRRDNKDQMIRPQVCIFGWPLCLNGAKYAVNGKYIRKIYLIENYLNYLNYLIKKFEIIRCLIKNLTII
jgi:hypothetical protein